MIPEELIVHYLWRESAGNVTKLLTTSYVATEGPASLNVAPYNVVTLAPVMSGTAVTSVELLVEISLDGSNWNPIPATAVSGATVTVNGAEISLVVGANGIPAVTLDIGAARLLKVSAKRTGGDATSSMLLPAVAGSLR